MNKKKQGTTYVPKTVTLDCPGCSAIVAAAVLGNYAYLQVGFNIPVRYLFARCPSCNAPMVAVQENYGDLSNDYDFTDAVRVLPARSRVGFAVPKSVAGTYDEATRCFGAQAYSAAAIMCRKALEELVREHKITARNLAESLKKMHDQGLIEKRLFEWADALRLTGNAAAHDVDGAISRDDAKDTLDFAGALIEYVFTFRDRFEDFKKRRASKKPTT